jgi:hypothetical protein
MTGRRQAATVLRVLCRASVLALPSGFRAAEHFLLVPDSLIRADALHALPGKVLEGAGRAAGNQRMRQASILVGCVLN